MLRRRERLCVNMSGVEVTGTEAPLKKESTGLGDRLTKAEGGPEMWLAGWEHWGGPGNTGHLEKRDC